MYNKYYLVFFVFYNETESWDPNYWLRKERNTLNTAETVMVLPPIAHVE